MAMYYCDYSSPHLTLFNSNVSFLEPLANLPILNSTLHQNKAITKLSTTTMTIMSNEKCNEIFTEEIERIKDCKLWQPKYTFSND